MKKYFENIIQNKIGLKEKNYFTAIIGSNPSQGARSPVLWNKVFSKYLPDIFMIPLDVKENDLKDLFNELENDKYFLGGAIAAPYKEQIYNYLNFNYDDPVKNIQTVNNLSRDKNGNLYGHNTDGLGALESLKKNFNLSKIEKILVLGYGGVGKAVVAYLSTIPNLKNLHVISNKSFGELRHSETKVSFHGWNQLNQLIQSIDLIVNCTTIGWQNENDTPISQETFSMISSKTIFFDVIYDPKTTKLIHLAKINGNKVLNGENMNFIQAVLAINNTLIGSDISLNLIDIQNAMQSI